MNKALLIQNRSLNAIKSLFLICLLAALPGLIAYILAGGTLAIFIFILIGTIYTISPMMAPKIVMRFYKTRPISAFDAPQFHRILRFLSSRAKLGHVPELHLIPTGTMAAFATGDRKQSAIALSTGLINRLNPDEIAGVLAHEISHVRNNDMREMWFALFMSRVTDVLSMIGQVLLIINLPLIFFSNVTISWVAIVILIGAPSLSFTIQLSLSRVNEFNADLGSVELVGTPEPLISALYKIETNRNTIFDRIFMRKQPRDASVLFQTHPPTKERIRRLKEMRDTSWQSNVQIRVRPDPDFTRRRYPPSVPQNARPQLRTVPLRRQS